MADKVDTVERTDMGDCEYCYKNMGEVDSCSANKFVYFAVRTVRKKLPAVKYEDDIRCHHCNVKSGGYHHPGCDMERCPRCEGQLISCNCPVVDLV